MARKGVFPIVATLAVVGVVLAVFSQTVMRDSNISTNTMTTEQAYADLSGKMKRIGVQEVSVNPQQLDVSEFLDAKDELPDIDTSYPFVVEGNGDVNIEIFSSGEKAAESGSDSFLTSMAKKFNAQHNKTSSRSVYGTIILCIPSGMSLRRRRKLLLPSFPSALRTRQRRRRTGSMASTTMLIQASHTTAIQ